MHPAVNDTTSALHGIDAPACSWTGPHTGAYGADLPPWAWAGIGAAGALLLVAAAAVLLQLWQRRRSPSVQQEAQHKPAAGHEAPQTPGADRSSGRASSLSGSLPWPAAWLAGSSGGKAELPRGLPSTNSILEALSATGSAMPQGTWKARMGFIEGLTLGGLIGKGGFARVYRGKLKGAPVAVKLAPFTHVGAGECYDLKTEPLLTLSLAHPNVIQGYKCCVARRLDDDDDAFLPSPPSSASDGSSCELASAGERAASRGRGGGRVVPHLTDSNCRVQVMERDAVLGPGNYELWMVKELADRGNLGEALAAGLYGLAAPTERNMPIMMLCLLDVARGLEYLHSCGVVHGDLKPQNVMLKTATADRRGFVCKIGDFGLSQVLLDEQTSVNASNCGTLVYAAPELLTTGRLSKAADSYAFGLLLYQAITGQAPFPGMGHLQILLQVAQQGLRPQILDAFPPPLADLAQRCWSADPQARPTATQIIEELIDYSAAYSHAARVSGPAAASGAGAPAV